MRDLLDYYDKIMVFRNPYQQILVHSCLTTLLMILRIVIYDTTKLRLSPQFSRVIGDNRILTGSQRNLLYHLFALAECMSATTLRTVVTGCYRKMEHKIMVRKGVVGTPILGQKSKHFLFKSDFT